MIYVHINNLYICVHVYIKYIYIYYIMTFNVQI